MTKQYLNKREYLGFRKAYYYVQYAGKTVKVTAEWISREYEITKARLVKTVNKDNFPYRRTPKVIDRIEELLK